MARRLWWQRPMLRTDEDQDLERKVSWLELFFDLYFVVVIAELAHYLLGHLSWHGVGEFAFLFLPVWWIWIGATYYLERFETEGVENRLFIFLQMIPIAGMAVFVHHGLGETSVGFGAAYAIARTIQIFLWWRGGYHDPQFRPVARRFVTGFTLAVALFYISLFVPSPVRFWLWGLGLFIDMITPAFTIQQQAKLPKFSTSKLPERYGLFMIIVLGESVLGVVQGVAARETLALPMAVIAILGIALTFGIWWVYFDFIGRRAPKSGTGWTFVWGYAHMPLAIAITAAGVGTQTLISDTDWIVQRNSGFLIGGAIGLALFMMGVLEFCLRHKPDEPTHPIWSPAMKLGAGVIAALVGGLSSGMYVLALQCCLMALIAVPMGYGMYVWFTQELEEGELRG
ncbi:low temperature requirement protein A [Leptothoe sp. PORK10 BA2]|uniref:low temperature requirement protein A n=1 Tax=Leptothoe sp. PORK10 BA2 TaxID=3110254 RepID=UPI002B209BDF|nr:low temperature requirement protein A [Leptothoe sp. PORK10 BA2]MEA5463137.1 low temperature requirement protein A [Leptothoe sp. PORK10 BA2]